MSDSDNSAFSGFGKFVPGFDFLQNLATQAAASAADKAPQLPNLGSWVAPTLNVEDLDKRIQELKAVQFWLDQNATALKATIQALEVQKMTLATLKGMNFNMGDIANAFQLKVADALALGVQGKADEAKTFAGLEVPPTNFGKKAGPAKAEVKPEAKPEEKVEANQEAKEKTKLEAPAAGVVDPMQWWGALTQQFQTIAADAMKDAAQKAANDNPKSVATGLAKDAMKAATHKAKNSLFSSAQAWPTPVAAKKPAAKKAAVKSAGKPPAKSHAKPPAKPATKPARKTGR